MNLIKNGAKELPITHKDMTRFLITLEEGVRFVLKNFERMQGGEIFIPKLPSMKIVDLAKCLAPNLPHKIIGIRPGEKLHEVMITRDDRIVEFDKHFVIKPTINFGFEADYTKNCLGEVGKEKEGFEYSSGNNDWWLSCKEFIKMKSEQ